ncbi:MAG: DUF4430 domain-containing protein [Clostridiales Family XIII bacterium]|jgi:predicted small lipoprotein YifL|nr:DUF4430 domain-containing protein [Clostridiales Family XIII bacterium]
MIQEVQEEKKVRSIGMRVFVFLLALLLTFGLGACGEKETPPATDKTAQEESATEVVHLTIDASRYFESDKAKLSKDTVGADEKGFIFDEDFTLEKEQSISDLLFATKVDFVDAGGYISEIGGIGGGTTGEMSGWLYTVNGEMPSVSVNAYMLKAGDEVLFVYSNDGGADAGFTWE